MQAANLSGFCECLSDGDFVSENRGISHVSAQLSAPSTDFRRRLMSWRKPLAVSPDFSGTNGAIHEAKVEGARRQSPTITCQH